MCLIVFKTPHDRLAFNLKKIKKTDRKKQGDRRKVREGRCRVNGLSKQVEFGTQKRNVLKAFQSLPAADAKRYKGGHACLWQIYFSNGELWAKR